MNANARQTISVILTLLTFALAPVSAAADEKSLLERYTEAVGDSEALAARDIAFLAQLGEVGNSVRTFKSRLEHLKDGDPKSLPALEAILNCEYWHSYSEINQTIGRLREPTTKVWYDIRWKDANEQERMQTAMMSIDPNSRVNLSPHVGADKIIKLGAMARPAVYKLLMSKADYTPNTINAGRVGSLADAVLKAEAFAPTEEEAVKVLQEGGEFGRYAMMGYLMETRQYGDAWFTAFSNWMTSEKIEQEQKRQLVAWLTEAAKFGHAPSKVMENRIEKVVLNVAKQSVANVVQNNAVNADYAMLTWVMNLLVRYSAYEHLDQLKRLHAKLRKALAQASQKQLLDDTQQYRGLRARLPSIAEEIEELEKRRNEDRNRDAP